MTVALLVAAFFTNATLSSGEREDRTNRWVIPALTVVSLAMAIAPPLCDRFDVLTFGGEGVRWTGVALYAVGGVLRLAPVFALGNRFSGLVAIQPGHRLKTDGLYGVIRHPSYLGLLIMCIGIPLVFRSLLAFLIWVPILAILVARMNSEERLLSETFGRAIRGLSAADMAARALGVLRSVGLQADV